MNTKTSLVLTTLFASMLLSACSSPINVSDRNTYGLKCSPNAKTAPNWQACQEQAANICGVQKVFNIQNHPPTESGQADDAYFMSFECR